MRIPFGKPHQALLVSERAIGTDQRQKYLLTVSKDNVVERREVKLGSLHDGLRVIESGIGPDDLVIVNGLQRAAAGGDGEAAALPRKQRSRAAPLAGRRRGHRTRLPPHRPTN